MRVPQCINDYLSIDACAFAIYLVGEMVVYVEEHHKVTGDSKAIWKSKSDNPTPAVRRETDHDRWSDMRDHREVLRKH